MRRALIWLTWLLLAAEVAGLALVPRPRAAAEVFSEVQAPLRMLVTQGKDGLSFLLENHDPHLLPVLAVSGRAPLEAHLRYAKPSRTATVVTLPIRELERYPALAIDFTWSLGGKEIARRHLYINPRFRYDWKMRRHELFTVYYVGNYPAARVEEWAEIYRGIGDFLLMAPVPQVIYLMPGAADLRRAIGRSEQGGRPLAGLWVEGAESIMLAAQANTDLSDTVAHELTHALIYNRNPIWWEEGIATWVAYKEVARGSGAATGRVWPEVALQALNRLAGEREIPLWSAHADQEYPLDRYTLGASFVLYVRARLGEPGVQLLAADAAKRPLAEALPEILGETPHEAEARWLAYIRSSRFLEDAAHP